MYLVSLIIAYAAVFVGYFIYTKGKKRKTLKTVVDLNDSLNSRRDEALRKLSCYIDINKENELPWREHNIKDIKRIEDAPVFSEVYAYMRDNLSMDLPEFLNAMYATPETIYMTQMLAHKKLYSRFVANGMWHEFYRASAVIEPLNYFMEPKSAGGLIRPGENMHDVATAVRIADRLNEFMWHYMVWYESKLNESGIGVSIISADPFAFNHAVSLCFSDVPHGDSPKDTVLLNRVVDKPERRVAYFVWESRFLRHGPKTPYATLEYFLQHDKTDSRICI